MRLDDQWRYTWQVLKRHRLRTGLLLLAVSIGVASVVLLTGLGEGARRYIDREFTALGNQMLIVLPGRKQTTGGAPPMFGATPRDLTVEDAQALRRIATIEYLAPIITGTALARMENRSREAVILGSNEELFEVRQLQVALGQRLPDMAADRAVPVAVLGARLKRELFRDEPALGRWLRLGDRRFRVIGVLTEKGESLGMDLRDMAIIPVRSAEQLFNSPGLNRVLIQIDEVESAVYTEEQIRRVIRQRHEGEDDVTIVTQNTVMESFNQILNTLTAALGAIAGISLLVAGILIMNVSLVSVSQRRQEIGLLKALGTTSGEVRSLFLGEAMALASLGALLGLGVAQLLLALARYLYPVAPLASPWWAMVSAVVVAVAFGLFFAWWPARRAAALDPVLALKNQA